jgi:hypothetical protein
MTQEVTLPMTDNEQSGVPVNREDVFLWGAEQIGAEINRSTRATHHLLSTGKILCAQKRGGRWVASRAKLRAEFGG